MILLGVETSCDETSAAVLDNSRVLSNIISSQYVHQKFGGVVPELASRAHLRLVIPVVNEALSEAKINKEELNGIAVTFGPGLVGALLVGLNFSKGLAHALDIPVIGVNHMEGHVYGTLISNKVEFPAIFLIVSGGHTLLVLMKDHLKYKILGSTRDDAVGEAYDKVAKILNLGYPGGPVIDKLAREGDPSFTKFPKAFEKEEHFDFSYSGLKTAVLTFVNKNSIAFVKENTNNICASFQKAAIDILVIKAIKAAQKYNVKSIAIGGGVAANSYLRTYLEQESGNYGLKFFKPEMEYCMDNAAMIARCGWEYLKRKIVSPTELNAVPYLPIKSAVY